MADGSEGRELQLINRKSLRLLTSQMLELLMSQEDGLVVHGLRVDAMSKRYLAVHGAPLNPCEYGFLSLGELLKSLPYLVEVSGCSPPPETIGSQRRRLTRVRPQLYHKENDDGSDDEWVRLTRLYQFARDVRALLHTYHYNQVFLTDFHGAYNKFTGSSLEPHFYGYMSTDDLLNAIPQVTVQRL